MKEYTVKVDSVGNIRWYKPGTAILHREDGPAVTWPNGNKFWCIENKLHREDGPAIEFSNGTKAWYMEDQAYTKEEFVNKTSKIKNSCEGKIVEIEGKKYVLKELVNDYNR